MSSVDEMPPDEFFDGGDEGLSNVVAIARRPSERTLPRSDVAPSLAPTASEPMRGRVALAKVAVVGANRIRELASMPVEYLWQDIALAGVIVVVAGGPGEGKTTLLFFVLVARMNLGAPVRLLGREVTPMRPGRFVVLIEGEHGESSASRKLVASCEILGVDAGCLDRVILIARKAVRIGSPEWLDVVAQIRAGVVSDIAIDTVARVAPADADNEREQVAIFDLIAQAIDVAPPDTAKPVAWIVAHTRKGGNGDSLADVSGSTQRTGQADSVLLVKGDRRDGRVVSSTVTFAKLREEPDDYPTPATFSIQKRPDGVRTLAAISTPTVDDRPLEARILDRLALGPHTKSKLAAELGRSFADLEEPISNLFAARSVATSTVRVRGREFKAFVLAKDAPRQTEIDTRRTLDEARWPDDTRRHPTKS